MLTKQQGSDVAVLESHGEVWEQYDVIAEGG